VQRSGVDLQPLEAGADTASARIEVIGDPARLTSIIEGKKDARMQFFAGGIRVRGDMPYLSEIGLRLRFLDRPLV
jgi:predicted lipid carrier protein YhbT